MLKLIFSDLDDTLLDSKKTVSDETINFIKGLKNEASNIVVGKKITDTFLKTNYSV